MVEALDAICKEHGLTEAVIRAGGALCLLLLRVMRVTDMVPLLPDYLCPRWTNQLDILCCIRT